MMDKLAVEDTFKDLFFFFLKNMGAFDYRTD